VSALAGSVETRISIVRSLVVRTRGATPHRAMEVEPVRKALWMSVVLLMVLCTQAFAVPRLLQYQGRLTDAAGTPLNGAQTVVFSIYSAASGGSLLWTESQSPTVANGLFNVLLGGTTAFPSNLFDGSNRFLAIKVGGDPEMTPRQQVASVGYAMRAAASEDVLWAMVRSDAVILNQSGGFTISHGAAGFYHLDHPSVDESAIGIVATSYNSSGSGTSPVVVTFFANDAGGIDVRVYNLSGVNVDHDFSIVAPFTTNTTGVLAPPAATLAPKPAIRVDSQNRPVR
jgi:hypothetical protein